MAEADLAVVRSEQEDADEEMGDYPTTSCSSDMESSRGSDDSRVTTLLAWLRRPAASELTRKQKLKTNRPPIGKKTSRGLHANDPKSVSAAERAKAYPNEAPMREQ